MVEVPRGDAPAAGSAPAAGARRGHPLHPVVTDFPLALWIFAAAADAVGLRLGVETWWAVAYWSLAAGVAAAVPALLTGLLEYAAIPRGHPAVGAATAHMVLMLVATGVFVLSLFLRPVPAAGGQPPPAAQALAWSGVFLLVLGGWFGGELVFRHGIGVRKGPGGD